MWQLLLLTDDNNTSQSDDFLLAHLAPLQRMEIARAIVSQWEEIAAHFGHTKDDIESEMMGGDLAKPIDKAKFLVEKISKKGITLQQMSNAMNQCDLAGLLKTTLKDIFN